MFNWLKQKAALDAQYLPKPTRPAPPMPECKPYSVPYQPYHQGEVILPAKSISEPVITLLEMLKRDEWEASKIDRSTYRDYFSFTNVFNEDIKLSCSTNTYDYSYCSGEKDRTIRIFGTNWMTDEEEQAVHIALLDLVERCGEYRRQASVMKRRDEFAKLIGVDIL